MGAYQTTSFQIPLVETFSPVIDLLNATSQGISAALGLASGVLQVLTPILTIGDLPNLDLGEAVRDAIDALISDLFDGSLDAFHLYPESQHKIYTYRQWLDLSEKIIVENPDIFSSTSRLMVWLVSAPDEETLLSSVAPLLSLFGLPPIEFEPASITRDALADFIPPVATSRPIDVLPGLRDLADGLIQTGDSFGKAQDLSDLANGAVAMLQTKGELLAEKIQALSDAIAVLEGLASITISRAVIEPQESPAQFVEVLRGCTEAPGQTELVAGSLFAYDASIGPFVESLL